MPGFPYVNQSHPSVGSHVEKALHVFSVRLYPCVSLLGGYRLHEVTGGAWFRFDFLHSSLFAYQLLWWHV